MRRGLAFTPLEARRDLIVRAAVLADDLGYEMDFVAEGRGSPRRSCWSVTGRSPTRTSLRPVAGGDRG
ncbi:hypothetical protein ACQP2Y_23080 [Actinoplanes sp. CA-051413]|uniref:hypothetical protein n=1 Tax=Actinoplanes sp. CA-051413 TaxID=3239899 RepID=UPI003D97BF05